MAMPPRSSSSSGMQSIRRELQRRRGKPLAPKSSIAKKPPTPPPLPPRQEDPSPTDSKSPPASAGTHTPRTPRPRPHPAPRPAPAAVSPSTPPPSRSAPSSAVGPAYRASPDAGVHHLRPGTEVGVRTRTTKLKTGKVLVLWLRATVVSPTDQGYEVVYDGNWPPGDPYGTVHVPRRHVRIIKPSTSPTTPQPSPPPSCAPSSSASDDTTAAAAQKKEMRPTTAGKSLRLIRSLWPELERQARAAAIPGY